MELLATLIEAFDTLNEKRRRDPNSLTISELNRWRVMRCQIEEALFQRPRDPKIDTRAHLRVPISLRVRYRVGKTTKHQFLSVLGEGGFFIDTQDPSPRGTLLDLEFGSAGEAWLFRVRGEVVWSAGKGAPHPGMGIRFIRLNPDQRRFINTLVDDTVRQGLLEHRRFTRVDTRLDAELTLDGRTFNVQTQDIGLGGLYIGCDKPVHMGKSINLRIDIPGGLPSIRTTAKVTHISDTIIKAGAAGFGAVFAPLTLDQRESIRKYMVKRVCGHLRSQGEEPRGHARLKRRIKLSYRAANSFGSTDARDLSSGGIFIQSRDPPPLGSEMEITLPNPATTNELHLTGNVVRVIAPHPQQISLVPGAGVSFGPQSSMQKEELTEMLKLLIILD